MTTLREFFEQESRRYLERLTELLDRGAAEADARELHQVARGLRGAAQIAREEDVYAVALALENAARRMADGALALTQDAVERARETVEDLRHLAEGSLEHDDARSRVEAAEDRWKAAGVEVEAPGAAEEGVGSWREFRAFAAREVAGIGETLHEALVRLRADPADQEALGNVLRRQRALLGSARLGDLPSVAEALHAVDDVTRMMVRRAGPLKEEWLDVYRAAREVLGQAREALLRGEAPGSGSALERLRQIHGLLMDRGAEPESPVQEASGVRDGPAPEGEHPGEDALVARAEPAPEDEPAPEAGSGPAEEPSVAGVPAPEAEAAAVPPLDEEPPPPHGDGLVGPGAAEDTPPAPAAGPEEDEVVEIATLLYTGEAALRAALELEGRLERMAGDDADAREAVEEVFDLIRLGLG